MKQELVRLGFASVRRWGYFMAALLAVVLVTFVLLPGAFGGGAAQADAYYPPSCVRDGYAPYWRPPHEQQKWYNYCYLGTDGSRWINSANYVLGVQRELYYLGISVGPLDGLFGSQTKAGVQFFQLATGLSPDGIVGYNTWFNLMAYVPWHYASSGYDYHRPVHGGYHGPDCFRHIQSNHIWQIWSKNGTWFVYFNAYGPD